MGNTTKGIKALPKLPVEERKYLFCNGLQFEDVCGGIPADVSEYSLRNSRPIRAAGITLDSYDSYSESIWLYKYSTGGTCTLAGTDKIVDFRQKRFLAFDAKMLTGAASNDFRVMLSKTKTLFGYGTEDNTKIYSFDLSETFKTYYIDLTEVSFTEGYVCFAGGALVNWAGTAGFYIQRIYLTDKKYKPVTVLYNRGDDQSGTNPPIGWEGYTDASHVAPTFAADEIQFASSDKICAAITSNAFELCGDEICLLADVNVTGGSGDNAYAILESPSGERLGADGIQLTLGEDQIITFLRNNIIGNSKEVIPVKLILTAWPGLYMNVKAIWVQ